MVNCGSLCVKEELERASMKPEEKKYSWLKKAWAKIFPKLLKNFLKLLFQELQKRSLGAFTLLLNKIEPFSLLQFKILNKFVGFSFPFFKQDSLALAEVEKQCRLVQAGRNQCHVPQVPLVLAFSFF